MNASHSTAILARDFSTQTTDTLRDRWTVGKLDLVIEALDGAPVAIICDQQTGFAEIGVTLTAAYRSGTASNGRVTITRPDGTTTNYRIDDIGSTIIPLAEKHLTGAKWRAVRAWMDLDRDARKAAAAELERQGGTGRGRVEVRPHTRSSAVVAFRPDRENREGRFAYTTVTV